MNIRLIAPIAFRYLRGKRSGNAVPVLSRISMAAIAVGAGALIVLFSVFNGFQQLVEELYKAFYPSVRVTPREGKFFAFGPQQWQQAGQTPGVLAATGVLEDNVLASSEDEQLVLTLKGIDHRYFSVNEVKPYVIAGTDTVSEFPVPTAMVGEAVAARMGIDVNNAFSHLQLFYPNSEASNIALDPTSAFRSLLLKPDGVFKIQNEFDEKYVLAPAGLAAELFNKRGMYSSIELKTKEGQEEKVRDALEKTLGPQYRIETRFEQNQAMYLVMRAEKWAVYAILLLVLLIASFNMVGGLSMLVLEKQKDMAILRTMGADDGTIRGIFITEGILWSLAGGLAGLLLGGLLCLGQMRFGWIQMDGNFIIKAFPVALQWTDFVLVVFTVALIGFLAAWYPAFKAARTDSYLLRSA